MAIKSTKNDIIAVTDAGSTPKKDWLEKLVEKIDDDIDVVSGFYLPDAKSKFEKILAELTFPKIEQINEKEFLPSSRSICFRKKCWEKVQGYPENSLTAEDTLFDLRLVEQKFNFVFAKDAVVFWRCRNNLKAVLKQWYLYAKGDGILGLVMNKKYGRRHYAKLLVLGYAFISLLFVGIISPILIPTALSLGCFYYFLYFIKRKNGLKIVTTEISALWKGPIILFTINLGQFLGIHSGFFKKKILFHG
nr:glycosyltransferase family 2 protein [Nitrosopumilus piranensis]